MPPLVVPFAGAGFLGDAVTPAVLEEDFEKWRLTHVDDKDFVHVAASRIPLATAFISEFHRKFRIDARVMKLLWRLMVIEIVRTLTARLRKSKRNY